ncbi:methyltransferase domain-containing protein [Amycolatopsis bartoniae]|uniref:methyltransferase domain-containing protein n=1 Tax=Amycolatopsis bartoniae TaxID=941986 RepID=UPI001193A280|nr:class I SAM-dependent methyltransferase [Amycolatopsis bartoniae]TVT09230.1 methyltransferase domain-containing protein [Amycolatopsis bartoniae]
MTGFEPGLLGRRVCLELGDGSRISLPVDRWWAPSDGGDELLLRRCTGPTVDLGCGPGRLTAALTDRGIPALGVDISPVAVALTRGRGAAAVCRNLFDRLPGEGRWRHALLADGNIGIGGDPGALLHRVGELLAPGGTALVEVERPGTGLRRGHVRLTGDGHPPGEWFAWAWLGVESLREVVGASGLVPRWFAERGGRWFAGLVKVAA